MKTYDVAIVGAGPAGAVAGFLCAESGLKTVIIEKKHLPRYKSCGGGVTARTIELLKRVNCFDPGCFDSFVEQLTVHLPGAGRAYRVRADKPFMGFVRRADFDMALTRMAQDKGARLRTGEAFQGFRAANRGKLEIATHSSVLESRILIGADGYTSRVRKQLERRCRTVSPVPALLGIEGDLKADAVHSLSSGHCHLFFNVSPAASYGWVFPRGDRLNAGLLIHMGALKGRYPNRLLDGFVENAINPTALLERRGGGMLPLFKRVKNPVLQRENVLLTGDAAGFADAWTGEGIYYAVKSAMLAHQSIRRSFGGAKGGLMEYSRLYRREILNELTLSYLFFLFFRRLPRAYHLLAHERIRRLFVPYIRGESGYPKILVKALAYSLGYKFGMLADNRDPMF